MLAIYAIIAASINDNLIFPDFPHLFKTLGNILGESTTYTAFAYSLVRTLLALILSFTLAFAFGSIAGQYKGVRYFLSPIINVMKLIPTPCVVFILFLFFFEQPEIGSFIVTFLVIFPILYESFIAGIDNIPEGIRLSLRLEGEHKLRSYFTVILPQSVQYLILGATNSLGLGVKVSIMSEILLGTPKIRGIGQLIFNYKTNSEYPNMFAIIILIILLFAIIDIFVKLIKKIVNK